MTVETDLIRGTPMEQASTCDNCGLENDREDFVYHDGDWLCPECYAEAQSTCDECGKETTELFPSAGQNLCRECFDAAQADAENVAVGHDVTSTLKRK